MKRLLVIANLHHASPRIPALLVPLSAFGWEITVVTPSLGDDAEAMLGLPPEFSKKIGVVIAPYRGDIFWLWRKLLRLFGFSNQSSYTEQIKERFGGCGNGRSSLVDWVMRSYQAFFAIPDTEWPWYFPALQATKKLFDAGGYDVVLSSSPFPTVHCVAAELKKRYPVKWVADFRDPWSQSHNYTLPKFRLHIDRWLERRTIARSDLITTVSTGVAEKLAQLHGEKVVVVRNGYQPIPGIVSIALPDVFTISYTGTIYAGKQDPNKVLAALRHLLASGAIAAERIALNFYGRYDSALQQMIVAHGLEGVAVQQGCLSRAEIRRRQCASHLLLLLQWEDPDEHGIFPLKFYEYLAAGRPILATGENGSGEIAAILEETKTGTVAVSEAEISKSLLGAYQEFLGSGKPKYCGCSDAIARYSFEGCAGQLASCLERVCQIQGNSK